MASPVENSNEWNQLESSGDLEHDALDNIEYQASDDTTSPKLSSAASRSSNHCTEEEHEEETAHFDRIIAAFLYYRRHSEGKLRAKVNALRSLPKSHLAMIPQFRDHLRQVHRCICTNYTFLRAVVLATGKIFENRNAHRQQDGLNGGHGENVYMPVSSEFNMDKLQSTLRQIVRDWTTEGEVERRQCYDPILNYLTELWPREEERGTIKVLIPGAGLGRLTFEVAKLGFECQGNEFSLFMLFVSNFILNRCNLVNEWTIFPYIHQWMNNWSYQDQIRPIQLPDINPSNLPPHTKLSMTAGDFLDVYGKTTTPGDDGNGNDNDQKWNVVATVFFIDTAHDIISYMETIHRILKPGGYWLNFGPLLYHFADLENEISLELPYEEIVNISKKLGFELLMEEKKVPTTYTQNSRSMLQYLYQCAFAVFRKQA